MKRRYAPKEFYNLHRKIVYKYKGKHWDWSWTYNRFHESNPYDNWFLGIIKQHFKNGFKVLDIAGGIGHYGTYLKRVLGYKFDYTIFDLHLKELGSAIKEYWSKFGVTADYIVGDLRKKLPEGKFDMIWLLAWEHIENVDLLKLFTRIYNILKPHGVFIFSIGKRWYNVSRKPDQLTILLNKIGYKILDLLSLKFADRYHCAVKRCYDK